MSPTMKPSLAMAVEITHWDAASSKFLSTWKRAIGIVDPDNFEIEHGLDYEATTDKSQLKPSIDHFRNYLNCCRLDEGLFLCALYSFFQLLRWKRTDRNVLLKPNFPLRRGK